MSKRRHDSEIIHLETPTQIKDQFATILPDPEWYEWRDENRTMMTVAPNPCILDCGDPDCREWVSIILLPGRDRREAVKSLVSGRSAGFRYHVPECQMKDDDVLPF